LTTTRYIPVVTTPLAALLAGHGLAEWLAQIGGELAGAPIEVRVANLGHGIAVSTAETLQPEDVRPDHYQQPAVPWILTAKNSPAPDGVFVLDYEAERSRNAAYYERLKDMRKAGINLRNLPDDERNALAAQAPRPVWPVVAMINQMGALNAHNKAVERWTACKPVYPELVQLIWTMTSGNPGALEQATEQWAALAKRHNLEKSPLLSATQAVNPEQGKGANRAKADKLDIGGMESFWLLEYFKYAGLYRGGLPRTVQGRKDRKTYVLMPAREGIELRWHQKAFAAFQQEFWASSAVKMDILAALRYTRLMLQDWEGAQRSTGRRRHPSDYVAGFAVASYKDLGSAVAVMNVSTINLPDWVAWPENPDHAQKLAQVVEDHQRIISALDETRSDEERLLRAYRDFLTSRDPALRAFFAFTAGYAAHTLSKMNKRQWVRRFTIENLKEIIMAQESARSKALKPIIDTPGFQHIATAIRQATVLQQYYKTEQNDNTYDVRYGLAGDLLRHSRDNREFMRALSEFLTEYSQENARVMDRAKKAAQKAAEAAEAARLSQENARVMDRAKGKPYRKRIPVSTEDIAQLAALIDEYDSQTIASMLIAFGYASEPRGERSPSNDSDADATENGAAEEQLNDQDEGPF
jgi:hypothetical protein